MDQPTVIFELMDHVRAAVRYVHDNWPAGRQVPNDTRMVRALGAALETGDHDTVRRACRAWKTLMLGRAVP